MRTTDLPPEAARIPSVRALHGDSFTDDYAWMKDRARTDERVLDHINAENYYTDAVMQHTAALQQQIYDAMLGRVKQTDVTAPERDGEFFYYGRTVEGLAYPIHCRTHRTLDAAEEVVLDQNALAEGHPHFQLGAYAVSPDHRLVAYSTATKGIEEFEVAIKEIATGAHLDERIPGTSYGITWANDNRTFFYRTMDDAHRENRVWRHRLGTDIVEDVMVFEEPDAGFYLGVTRARSRKFIFIQLGSMTTNEAWFIDADSPETPPRLLRARTHGIEFSVEHQGARFLIRTNEDAKNFRVMEAPVDDPRLENWREVIPHRPGVKIDAVDPFEGHLVLSERIDGLPVLRVVDTATNAQHVIDLPDPVYEVALARNPEYATTTVRFTYESLVTPPSWFDEDMSSRERTLRKQQEVPGYDPARFRAQRVWARAADGTAIPISLVTPNDLPRDGVGPLWLYAYGSYGASMEAGFWPFAIELLERGFTFAIAHIRGGGELGEEWREAGRLLNKRNTFDDFIACAEHLIGEGFTREGRIVANGGSAGGLLMGAITNLRPDLFAAIVAEVPFVDVINTIVDPELLFSVLEYEEWGDPHEPEAYKYIRTYSPYENVSAQDYPDILATTGLWDPRVNFWEPAKWVARLRALRTDQGRTLLKTRMAAGHFGSSGRYERLREQAFNLAFALDALGIAR